MISIKCPHCQVSLKVNEGKLPLGITSFKCPNCKQSIPMSLVTGNGGNGTDNEPETVLLHPVKPGIGRLEVQPNDLTPSQTIPLTEGTLIIGRKSKNSTASHPIETQDLLMSRSHICIQVEADGKGGYKHLLKDNNSKNHTLYKHHYLEKDEVVVLHDGDEIVIGRTTLLFKL